VKNDFVPSVGDTVVEAERGYGIGEGVAQALCVILFPCRSGYG
jgi:hypothetical protein